MTNTKFQTTPGRVSSRCIIALIGAAQDYLGLGSERGFDGRVCGAGRTSPITGPTWIAFARGETASTGDEILTPQMKRAEAIAFSLRTQSGRSGEWVNDRPSEVAGIRPSSGLMQRTASVMS